MPFIFCLALHLELPCETLQFGAMSSFSPAREQPLSLVIVCLCMSSCFRHDSQGVEGAKRCLAGLIPRKGGNAMLFVEDLSDATELSEQRHFHVQLLEAEEMQVHI